MWRAGSTFSFLGFFLSQQLYTRFSKISGEIIELSLI